MGEFLLLLCPYYLLFLNFLESRVEMQEMATETIAEEHTDWNRRVGYQ